MRPRRVRGKKARGLAYERKFGKYLKRTAEGEIFANQWFRFEDANGLGWAQTDYFVKLPSGIILFECKLSERPAAWVQLRRLYSPILQTIFSLRPECVQVCKYVTGDGPYVDEFDGVRDGTVFHWLDY